MKSLLCPYFCILSLIAILCGCGGSSTSVNIQNGALTGVVSLGSEWTSSPLNFPNSAGVTVALDQTALSTTTDSTGFWKFDNVPAGNYDVTISKSGFGLIRVYGFTVEGPGTAYIPHIDLGEVPSTAPKLEWARIADRWIRPDSQYVAEKDLEVRWTSPLDCTYAGLCIFLDKDSLEQPGDVHWNSALDAPEPWEGWFGGYPSDTTPFSSSNEGLLACPVNALHASGIPSGSTVYISLAQLDPYTANGAPPYNEETYYDPVHNQNRLISPSPRSNVIAVVVP